MWCGVVLVILLTSGDPIWVTDPKVEKHCHKAMVLNVESMKKFSIK